MTLGNEIRTSFSGKEHLLRLMLINTALFLFFAAIKLFSFLGLPISARQIGEWIELPANLGQLIQKPWTLFTYMFIHYNFVHVLFNLLVMYWTGRIFSDFLPQKKLTAAYVLGGIAGGIAFVAMYNIIPAFESAASGRIGPAPAVLPCDGSSIPAQGRGRSAHSQGPAGISCAVSRFR